MYIYVRTHTHMQKFNKTLACMQPVQGNNSVYVRVKANKHFAAIASTCRRTRKQSCLKLLRVSQSPGRRNRMKPATNNMNQHARSLERAKRRDRGIP